MVLLAAPAGAVEVGGGERARPGLRRVPAAEAGKVGQVAAAVDLGGGVTEALTDTDSSHQRFAARAALAADVARWLSLGAWVSGRYDLHPKDADGADDGFLVQGELSARAAFRSGGLGYGFEAGAALPGASGLGDSLSAVGAEGRGFVGYSGTRAFVGGYVGSRLDRSANAAGDVKRLRFGDRVALGASDYDALLGGLGAAYLAGGTLLYAEISADALLGAPELASSPLWLTLGARRPLGPRGLSAEVGLDVLASARPDLGASGPLQPIEPRAMLYLGLRYRVGDRTQERPVPPVAKPAPPPVVAPAPPKPETQLELELKDERGQPLLGATVTVRQGDSVTPLVAAAPGRYRLNDVRPGRAKLHVEAPGFRATERDIELVVGKKLGVELSVEPALPPGQVRGLVRSFRGKPLLARVRLEPGGAEAHTDAEGFFQIDVPPGDYEVLIEATGYQPQRRKAKVEQQGVVIVNADLSQ